MRLVEVLDKSGCKYRVNTAQIVHIEELSTDEHRITFGHVEKHLLVDKANLYRIEAAFLKEGQTLERPVGFGS
jgi:ribosomal protein L21